MAAAAPAMNGEVKLSFLEKVGYSFGDGAAQFVYLSLVNFQPAFYTDALGIDPGWASFILLIARLWDAFFDPMMGHMADRTRTRWGRFRPWILWTSIPWGIFMVLAFTVPPTKSFGATLAYALVTNIALWTIYSMNNTPYSALMAVMTGDQKQRTNLSQYRFITAMVGQLIVGGFTLALMNSFGGPLPPPPTALANEQLAAMTRPAGGVSGDPLAKPVQDVTKLTTNDTPAMKEYRKTKQEHDARGWPRTMAVFGVLCFVLFLLTFFMVKERILPAEEKHEPSLSRTSRGPPAKPGIGRSFSIIMTNWPWLVMFAVTITHYILSTMRGSAYFYYFQYVLDRDAMARFVSHWPLPRIDPTADVSKLSKWMQFMNASKLVIKDNSTAYITAYGLLQMTNKVWNVVGIIAASGLVMAFSKKWVVALSLIVNTVFIVALYFVPVTHIWGVFIVEWLGQLAYAPTVPLLWVLFADVCDFTEWKTGVSITGFIYATFFFGVKAGIALGSFLGLQVMQFFGYAANLEQTAQSKHGIILTISLIPGVFSIIGALGMLFYPVSKKMNNEISAELSERRRIAAAEAVSA